MYMHAERPHTHSPGQSSVDYGSTKRIRHALKVSRVFRMLKLSLIAFI